MITKAKFSGRQYNQQMKSDEEIWRSKMSGYFSRTKKKILKANDRYDPTELIYQLPELIPVEPIYDIYDKLYKQLGYKYYRTTRKELLRAENKAFENKGEWEQAIQIYIDTEVATRITGVVDVSREVTEKAIRAAVQEALENGYGIEKTKRLINKTVDAKWLAMRRNRARTIARTETITSLNHASYEGALSTGLEVTKAWLPYRDSRTREDHAAMDSNDYIPIDADFIVGGQLMQHPGDPRGSASNVINCRCGLVYKTPDFI